MHNHCLVGGFLLSGLFLSLVLSTGWPTANAVSASNGGDQNIVDLENARIGLVRKSRAAVPTNALRWPNATVPYIIEKVYFTHDELNDLMDAIRTWNEETCLQFRPRLRGDKNWLRITDGQNCNSQYLGFSGIGGEQTIEFSKNGCRFYGLYMHELGHALALDHEHVRADRDRFVHVSLEGVPKEYWPFYERKASASLSTYDTPYDLQSVMHYGPGSFSVHANKSPLTVRDPSVRHVLREVYTKDLSFWDAKAINQHYQCASKCTGTIPYCPRPGFIDKNCKCQTPAEFSKRRCIDALESDECSGLANRLECYRNASFMAVKCRATCGFCFKQSLSEIAKTNKRRCGDFHEHCEAWEKSGQCNINSHYMRITCPKSCKFCGATKALLRVSDNDCEDTYIVPEDCQVWVKDGECTRNKFWMLRNCAASCGRCRQKSSTSPAVTNQPPVDKEFDKAKNIAITEHCNDADGSSNCLIRKGSGQCQSHKQWMERHCKKSCEFCVINAATTHLKVPRTTVTTDEQMITDLPSKAKVIQVNEINKKIVIARPLPSIGVCKRGDPAGVCPLHFRACTTVEMFRKCPNICGNCGPCEDRHWRCKVLKESNYCQRYALSTLPYCRKSCGACKE